MKELLEIYSISEILLFVVLLTIALKWAIGMWDWGKDWLQKKFQIKFQEQVDDANLTTKLTEISNQIAEMHSTHNRDLEKIRTNIAELSKTITILMASDKDDIKSWITEKHHYFCYEKKAIDDFSLDCIEKRYEHYKDEGGNSYIATLMQEIRALPKVSVIRNNQKK